MMAMSTKGWGREGVSLPESIEELKCELYPKNAEQMFEEYKSMYPGSTEALDELISDAIERTHDIAHDLIETITPDTSMKLPHIPGDPFQILRDMCIEAMEKRGLDKKKTYVNRLATELGTIRK